MLNNFLEKYKKELIQKKRVKVLGAIKEVLGEYGQRNYKLTEEEMKIL